MKRAAGAAPTLRKILVRLLLGAALLLAAALPASAATTWHSVPLWGGDVRSVAFAPDDPNVALAGTASGQVYLSRDAGATWGPAGQMFPLTGWVVAGLQFDPNHPHRVWGALRGVFGGGAVVRSDDLGRSWEMRTLRSDDEVFALALVPGEEGRLLIGTRSGVWGSTDGGAHWKHLSEGQPDLVEVSSLLVHPESPQTVLAGTFRRAFRSDDGGVTWRGVFDGMVLDTEVFSFTAVPRDDNAVWASTCGWVYESTDRGEHWVRHKDGLTERRATGVQAMPSGRLLVGTVAGIYASDDRGTTWKRETRDDLSVLTLAYHPKHPEVVLAATEGSGIWRSTDGGDTFQPASRGVASARVTALAHDGDGLLAAVSHGGPAGGLYGIPPNGRRAQQLVADIPTVLALAVNGDAAWAATEGGLYARKLGLWARVDDLPASRFEQVLASDGRVVARAIDGLWELDGNRFAPVKLPGTAISAAFDGGNLMVVGKDAAWQVASGASRKLTLPAGGQLGSMAGSVFLAGSKGLWTRATGESEWREHSKASARVVPTGDAAFPAVVVGDDGARLFVAADRSLQPLPLPIAARDVLAAAVDGGNLFLGTSGYGVIYASLADLAPRAAAPAAGTIAATAGAQR